MRIPILSRPGEKRLPPKAVALAAAFVVVALAVGGILSSGDARLSAYEPSTGGQGLVEFGRLAASAYETGAVLSSPHALAGLTAPERVLLVIAGVEKQYLPSEVDAIEAFGARGGRVVLADDFGYGNDLSIRHGIELPRKRLFDAAFEENASIVRVNATIGPSRYDLRLNVPSGTPSATCRDSRTFACSSNDSYLDVNGNGARDASDFGGPVAIGWRTGNFVVLTDPSLFADAMLRQGDNERFARDLLASLLPDGGTVVFEESRHRTGPLDSAVANLAGIALVPLRDPLLSALTLASAAFLFVLALVAIETPEDLRIHRVRLSDARRSPVSSSDLIRSFARERIRIEHSIDPATARDLTNAGLSLLVKDQEIADLLRLEGEIPEDKIDHYVQKIKSYRGPAG